MTTFFVLYVFMDKVIDFFTFAEGLKWKMRKSARGKDRESMAAHCFKVALLGWVLGEKKRGDLDVTRVIKMMLVHDFAKVDVGDTGPHAHFFASGRKRVSEILGKWPKNVSREEKNKIYEERYRKEERWVKKLVAPLGPKLAREMLELWKEYEKGITLEAHFANQVGALENLLQAIDHKKKDPSFDLSQWWFHAKKMIDDPILLEVVSVVESEDDEMRNKDRRRKGVTCKGGKK